VSREGAIKVEGAVVEVLNERLFRVQLSNGHRLLAHLPRGKTRHAPQGRAFGVGEKVTVEMSPFDFSKGRVSLDEN
jgi:translation initiation factor IF-1